jgi:urease accessory protein
MSLRAHLPFESRVKSRLLFRLDNGEQAALIVERGRLIRSGETITIEDGRAVEIVAADEALLEATSEDPLLVTRAAYHLGNRHVAVQLTKNGVRFLEDHVLREMVAGLGLQVTTLIAPFDPEGGAYGHSHAHGSDTPLSRPKIHSFSSP